MTGAAHTPQVGDWVVTFGYVVRARKVLVVKPKTLMVASDWGSRTDRVNISDVEAFSPDKDAIDLLMKRIESAIAEKGRRIRAANDAYATTRDSLLSDFASKAKETPNG